LDFRSEGLLLLSDDGKFIQKLTDPQYKHPKTYLAQVEYDVPPETIIRLETEILLPGLQTRLPLAQKVAPPIVPERPVPVRAYHPTSWLRIILFEGKKHQVRRLTAAVGHPTLRLVRVAIGDISLGELMPGQWRYLSPDEVQNARQSPSLHRSRVKYQHDRNQRGNR
jgi:23S rRNA pseudouridine2457 synthase